MNISADDILKYIFYSYQILGFDIELTRGEISKPTLWGKIRKNVMNMSSTELTKRVVKVKQRSLWNIFTEATLSPTYIAHSRIPKYLGHIEFCYLFLCKKKVENDESY